VVASSFVAATIMGFSVSVALKACSSPEMISND